MQYFINKYSLKEDAGFSSIIEDIDVEFVYVLGRVGNAAMLTRINLIGDVEMGFSYFIYGEKVSVYKYVKCPDGSLILYGTLATNSIQKNHHFLIKVNYNAHPIWVKKFHSDKTRFNVDITNIGYDEYAFVGWYNRMGSQDEIEIIKINGDGALIISKKIILGTDDQVTSVIPYKEGIAIVGGTNSGSPWDGFIMILDRELNVQFSSLLNNLVKNSVDDIYFAKQQGPLLLLSGRSVANNETKTFFNLIKSAEGIERGVFSTQGVMVNIVPGDERVRKILPVGQYYYLLGYGVANSINYVLKFSENLQLIWAKTFEIGTYYNLYDIVLKNEGEIWLSGLIRTENGYNSPLLIKTDLDLTTCKTKELIGVEFWQYEFEIVKRKFAESGLEVIEGEYDVSLQDLIIEKIILCPEKVFEFSKDAWVQSPYLYLQSAGSLGIDSSEGILLRWFLLGNLGDSHLPKGDYASNTNNFNKPDDYVKIFRAAYDTKIQRTLSLINHIPIYIDNLKKLWIYKLSDRTLFYFHFQDHLKYDDVLANINPGTDSYNFINAYGESILEIEIRDHLAFSVEYIAGISDNQFSLKSEVVSLQENLPLADMEVTGRHNFDFSEVNHLRHFGENIKCVRISIFHGVLSEIRFETYTDFLKYKVTSNGWTAIGQYALTKDTNEAYKRLEDANRFRVHEHWQKFNDDAFVNIQNYKDRWTMPSGGLAAGVDKYIALSENDSQAIAVIQGGDPQDKSMEVSYLSLLHFAATDYHVARMLGLGYIDTPGGTEQDKYIYLAEYHTIGALDITNETRHYQHLSMSPPTAKADQRLPQLIEPLPVEYGLSVPNGTAQPLQLTDTNGYIPFGRARYIQLKAKLTANYSVYIGFFDPPLEYSTLDYSPPVFAGVEYRNQGDANWQRPEIPHDQVYKDAGPEHNFETLALPFDDKVIKPILIQKETTEGVHEYACYAINIFSRASEVSTKIVQTDYTLFIKPNTLIPPHQAHVQLIQKEDPLILTSLNEQNWLDNIANNDKTFVRLTFYYSHLHDINYGFGNQVEIFFREELPRDTNGGIKQVQNGAASDKFAWVNTQDYPYTSETVTPNIPPSLVNNFKGGVFVVNENRYIIEDIILTYPIGNYPSFKLKKNEDRNTVDLGNGAFGITQTYEDINASPGDLFLVVENMAKAYSWGTPNPLNFKVSIGDSSWTTRPDNYINEEGKLIEQELRGIWDTAKITESATTAGIYTIEFDNYLLGHHPQYIDLDSHTDDDSVDWYKGVIRVRIKDDTNGNMQRKAFDVLKIKNIGDGNKLIIYVQDESYELNNTGQNTRPGQNIQTGNNIEVNFYPGYRVHLYKDTANGFSEGTIMPGGTEDFKKTIVGLRSVDTTTVDAGNNPYASRLGVPFVLFAQSYIEPGKPKKPSGPMLFTTEPDFFGKCNYTFTVEFNAEPYAIVFYRAEIDAILNALYKHETIYGAGSGIKAQLPPQDEDEYFTDRFQDLVDYNKADGQPFSTFPPTNGYAFPIPDNIVNGFDGTMMKYELIKSAIHGAFTPLTEQPLIYSFISKDPNYIPLAKKQTIRDHYGKLLDPNVLNSGYDQAPMAKILGSSGLKVQFADFTLDGEMSKDTAYFYCAREINKQMKMGEYGEIWGPVRLINTKAPEAPIVKKITTQLADIITGTGTAVNFEINEYPASQNIKKIDIYRAYTAKDALSPITMKWVKTIDLAPDQINDGIISLQDDFHDVLFVPYGEPLYYRLIALKEVKYVDRHGTDITKYVPSKPTTILMSNVVDIFNPEPPTITATFASNANNLLTGLELKWNKTAHNAKYYLYKMNSAGNWNKIYEIKSNDENDLKYTFPDPIPKVDEDGKTIYHRFKVSVENASGLFNLREEILTV